jgi:hypothetical protein
MNSVPPFRLPATSRGAPACIPVVGRSANHLDMIGLLHGGELRLPGVNCNQKGLRQHRQRSIGAPDATKAETHSHRNE